MLLTSNSQAVNCQITAHPMWSQVREGRTPDRETGAPAGALLPELPREERILEQCKTACPDCGGYRKPLGVNVSGQLEVLKTAFRVIRHIRSKRVWAGTCSVLVAALVDALPHYVMAGTNRHADDTKVQVLAASKAQTKTGRLLTDVWDVRSTACPDFESFCKPMCTSGSMQFTTLASCRKALVGLTPGVA